MVLAGTTFQRVVPGSAVNLVGVIPALQVIIAIAALEKGLHEAGYAVELGKGLSTVQSILVGNK